MRLLRDCIFIIIACFSIDCAAQQWGDETLLTIDGNQYDAGTFMRIYQKNLDIVQDQSQKDVDNYLQLYIDYRLKLLQAYEMELEKNEAYLKELASYRSSLAESYLTDNEITQSLVEQAYYRTRNEVNASHILVNLERSAIPEDTLKAYLKIKEFKNKIEQGEPFEEVAGKYSEGPSAENGGELGWFGPFKMVYDFEQAAYNTKVGEVSDIFRTDYGYHIVKVNDMRTTPADVKVAHIMTYDKEEDSAAVDAKERIYDIYEQLQSGKEFAAMAREFSEDTNSASQGGALPQFGSGGLNAPEFEKAAFELKEVNAYTAPIKSRFGWHIIQLLEKFPVPDFEQSEPGLRSQILKSPSSRKITESFTNKLIEKYEVQLPVINNYTERFSLFNDSLMTGTWKYENLNDGKSLFKIEDTIVTDSDFYNYMVEQQGQDLGKYGSLEEKLAASYSDFEQDILIGYYDTNLERDNEDFAFIYREYKEGLLLFELMEKKVWEAAKNDSLGQMEYYNNHKDQYQWKRRLDIDMTQNTTPQTAKEVQKMLKKGKSIDEIKAKINSKDNKTVMVSSGVVEDDYSRLPSNFEVREGISKIYDKEENGFFKVIRVNEVMESTSKSFEEARGSVINDYQQQLEKEWLEGLREGRSIEINEETLELVKEKIKKLDAA